MAEHAISLFVCGLELHHHVTRARVTGSRASLRRCRFRASHGKQVGHSFRPSPAGLLCLPQADVSAATQSNQTTAFSAVMRCGSV